MTNWYGDYSKVLGRIDWEIECKEKSPLQRAEMFGAIQEDATRAREIERGIRDSVGTGGINESVKLGKSGFMSIGLMIDRVIVTLFKCMGPCGYPSLGQQQIDDIQRKLDGKANDRLAKKFKVCLKHMDFIKELKFSGPQQYTPWNLFEARLERRVHEGRLGVFCRAYAALERRENSQKSYGYNSYGDEVMPYVAYDMNQMIKSFVQGGIEFHSRARPKLNYCLSTDIPINGFDLTILQKILEDIDEKAQSTGSFEERKKWVQSFDVSSVLSEDALKQLYFNWSGADDLKANNRRDFIEDVGKWVRAGLRIRYTPLKIRDDDEVSPMEIRLMEVDYTLSPCAKALAEHIEGFDVRPYSDVGPYMPRHSLGRQLKLLRDEDWARKNNRGLIITL